MITSYECLLMPGTVESRARAYRFYTSSYYSCVIDCAHERVSACVCVRSKSVSKRIFVFLHVRSFVKFYRFVHAPIGQIKMMISNVWIKQNRLIKLSLLHFTPVRPERRNEMEWRCDKTKQTLKKDSLARFFPVRLNKTKKSIKCGFCVILYW